MPDRLEDPSPSKFRSQAVMVAIVLIILGIIVFFIASAIAGGVIALLGAAFGIGSQVAKDNPVE
ncbi:MAG TPA: hypothetical protein VLE74_03705 [Candidatus Saccharimonadales bacterium]|nr:hypothetical protein [Candidatus Saccharimonadales bacterium]